MSLTHQATDQWDETLWTQAELVYHQAFPEEGRKNRAIIRRMFTRKLCTLHTWHNQSEVVAMALTAVNEPAKVLVMDYIAVRQDWRGSGVGKQCMKDIRAWAVTEAGCKGIVIEVEAEENALNQERVQFWERVGFQLTDYIHPYIWVPETYRAMFMNLDEDAILHNDGRILFNYITDYHEKAYRGK